MCIYPFTYTCVFTYICVFYIHISYIHIHMYIRKCISAYKTPLPHGNGHHNLESDSRYSGSSLKNSLPLPLGLHAYWVATLPTDFVDLHLYTYREIYKMVHLEVVCTTWHGQSFVLFRYTQPVVSIQRWTGVIIFMAKSLNVIIQCLALVAVWLNMLARPWWIYLYKIPSSYVWPNRDRIADRYELVAFIGKSPQTAPEIPATWKRIPRWLVEQGIFVEMTSWILRVCLICTQICVKKVY